MLKLKINIMTRCSFLLMVSLLCSSMTWAVQGPADRLAKALQFKTISYQDRSRINYPAFTRMLEFLAETYPEVFAAMEVETVNDYSLLMVWPGIDRTREPVLFTAHLDVVPVEPGTEHLWDQPPFAGVIEDGRIYGRGALDDKQGVMSLLEAAQDLLAQGYQPDRTLVFAFGHDEEIGGADGAGQLAAAMTRQGMRFAWMVDEGGMIIADGPLLSDRPMALINVAEKGYLTLTLTVTAEGGHSSRPPEVTSIGRLSNALARIEANPFPPRLVPPVRAMFETVAPHVNGPNSLIFGNLWLTGPLVARQMGSDQLTNSFVRTTTALTMFNAGMKENASPQRAEAKVNFRLLPGDSPEMVVDRITQ
ncbi:MAG: M20/M25/M40 family metallo-hydrolase, partial [Pseudomonadota bacterium]